MVDGVSGEGEWGKLCGELKLWSDMDLLKDHSLFGKNELQVPISFARSPPSNLSSISINS
jgi:hypothetical protein